MSGRSCGNVWWAALLTAGMVIPLSACTASEETRKNGAHFASWQHMGYSLWPAPPGEITERDVVASQRGKWWGEPEVIRVGPIQ
jgi:hypothetical protein